MPTNYRVSDTVQKHNFLYVHNQLQNNKTQSFLLNMFKLCWYITQLGSAFSSDLLYNIF